MNRVLYSILFYLAVPLVVVRLLWRSIKAPEYRRRWGERFGFIPEISADPEKSIWVHSVSVGETLAAVPLIKSLQAQYPGRPIVVTTMTPTGSVQVRKNFANTVHHVYAPYDLPGSIKRFIRRAKPQLLIIMETEIWPNMIYYSHKSGVKILLANARLSEKSAQGYRRFPLMTEQALINIDCIAAQSISDSKRFKTLCPNSNTIVTGSLKFNVDVSVSNPDDDTVFESIRKSDRKVLIAASTRDGEEEKILTAFSTCLRQFPSLLLILVPRHPERFNRVARLCESRNFRLARRSENHALSNNCQIFLGDSMGEMMHYFSLADIAFVGGSLVDTGCHNVLEPAAMGIPVLAGPSQFNFATICSQLKQAGALRTVQNETELSTTVNELLMDEQAANSMATAGKKLVEANKDALPKLMNLIKGLLNQGSS